MPEPKSKHPASVEKYPGSLEDLARDLKNMRYDKLAEFLGYLAKHVEVEADNDAANGKIKLPLRLYAASKHLYGAQEEIDFAWKISKPYMKNE